MERGDTFLAPLIRGRLKMTPLMTSTEKAPPRETSDTVLVKKCLAGKEEAWSELIDKYKALIYSIPVKYGLPPQEAADVFQATCMELLTRLGDLREPRALPKWLIQVAHHMCFHWKRQQRRMVSREEQMLREAMAALQPRCRKLIEMLFYETPSRPYTEVAKELGLAVGSIGLTREKCIERLRKRLEELGFS